jgi:serine/threonine protein kinase
VYLPKGTELHNRYIIANVLGHGGFGITYAAHDKVLNVMVAVKEYLPRQLATRAEGGTKVSIFTGEARQQYDYGLRKFLEEAQSVARFANHPNVVSARDYFEANGTAYMVMEYVEGVTLKEYLGKKGGRISYEEAKGIMMPVMDALREVHQAGMLHRDISPDNIYITTSAQVKILDFGAARYFAGEQSKSLSVILKSGYAPEEQYRSSGKQGAWTDVYAVGATIYKALTGQTPPDALDRMAADTLEPPSRLGVKIPPPAERALLQALAINAAQRFQDIEEFQQALLGNAAVTMGFQRASAPFQPAPEPGHTPIAAPTSAPVSAPPPVNVPSAAHPSHYPHLPRRSANPAAIASGIGAGVLGLVLLVVLVWRLVAVDPRQKAVVKPLAKEGHGPVIIPPPPPQIPTEGPKPEVVPPQPPLPAPDALSRFKVGRQWAIDWQSRSKYRGAMQIRQQLAVNRYLARITVSYFSDKNKEITVSMDGLLTIRGKEVVINCSNASKSWWDTDDFYLDWHDDTMSGYNIDKKGRRGNAVFRFKGDSSPTPPELSSDAFTPIVQGYDFIREGKYELAKNQFAIAVKGDRYNSFALNNLAVLKEREGKMNDALADLKDASIHANKYLEKVTQTCFAGGGSLAAKPIREKGDRSSIAVIIQENIKKIEAKLQVRRQQEQERQALERERQQPLEQQQQHQESLRAAPAQPDRVIIESLGLDPPSFRRGDTISVYCRYRVESGTSQPMPVEIKISLYLMNNLMGAPYKENLTIGSGSYVYKIHVNISHNMQPGSYKIVAEVRTKNDRDEWTVPFWMN